jgi:hypothetical protein
MAAGIVATRTVSTEADDNKGARPDAAEPSPLLRGGLRRGAAYTAMAGSSLPIGALAASPEPAGALIWRAPRQPEASHERAGLPPVPGVGVLVMRGP